MIRFGCPAKLFQGKFPPPLTVVNRQYRQTLFVAFPAGQKMTASCLYARCTRRRATHYMPELVEGQQKTKRPGKKVRQ
jgi:hypothetical protein